MPNHNNVLNLKDATDYLNQKFKKSGTRDKIFTKEQVAYLAKDRQLQGAYKNRWNKWQIPRSAIDHYVNSNQGDNVPSKGSKTLPGIAWSIVLGIATIIAAFPIIKPYVLKPSVDETAACQPQPSNSGADEAIVPLNQGRGYLVSNLDQKAGRFSDDPHPTGDTIPENFMPTYVSEIRIESPKHLPLGSYSEEYKMDNPPEFIDVVWESCNIPPRVQYTRNSLKNIVLSSEQRSFSHRFNDSSTDVSAETSIFFELEYECASPGTYNTKLTFYGFKHDPIVSNEMKFVCPRAFNLWQRDNNKILGRYIWDAQTSSYIRK